MIENSSRLSQIETLWSVVRRAHGQENTMAVSAQQQLLDIYSGAIRRYLIASMRDANAADDLFQEFAVKFVKGDFRHADPDRGRFRFYVKRAIHNLINRHRQKSAKRKEQALVDQYESHDDEAEPLEDQLFHSSWRDDLLDKTWNALAEHEQQTGVPYFTILKTRVDSPTLASEEFAQRLTELLGKPMTAGTARVNLHRAREKFAKTLIETIATSLENPNREAVESELIDLGLIDYCRDSLDSIPPETP